MKGPLDSGDPRDSLPTEKVEGGLREALRSESWEADDVFGALDRFGGGASRIVLADAEEESHPVIAPPTPADQRLSRGRGQYRVDGELARGGMGVVLKGHDTDLGRDVALKVMHPELSARAESVQRFVEEAQIGGQLQHPGIVPVYELGLMADERPYFAMKLIKGRTLASLFSDRDSPTSEQRRFLGLFEQVCQTVAYAHARGVIHRDLKPSNVMVGSFGEVQVVDWGLAKVLPRGGVADEQRARASAQVSVIETVRSEHGSSHSRAGSVMGTPAYMAPEQARGEVAEVTERADVFSLGAILCELLTGEPPYTGGRDTVMTRAASAELLGAKRSLAECTADEELVGLALRCLAPAPGARPHNAEAVARAVQAHLTSVEERAREARMAAERAQARAAAERKARKLTTALAATVLVAILAGGGGFALLANQRQVRRERATGLVNAALNDATVLRAEGDLQGSLAAAQRAEAVLKSHDVGGGLSLRVSALSADVGQEIERAHEERSRSERQAAMLARLDQIRTLERHESIFPNLDGHTPGTTTLESEESNWQRRDRAYALVLADFGLSLEEDAPEGIVPVSQATDIGPEFATRLDDWARVVRRLEGRDSARGLRLLGLAQLLDPDPWRGEMRAAIAADDVEVLRGLTREMEVDTAPPATWTVLGDGLEDLGARDEAVAVLTIAQRRYPGDSTLSLKLGILLERRDPDRRDVAVRYKQAAVAAKPNSFLAWYGLGYSLRKLEEFDEAVSALERAVELDPDNPRGYANLAHALQRMGRGGDAVEAARAALRLQPDEPWYLTELASFLFEENRIDEGVVPLRRAVELEPNAYRHEMLASGLRRLDRFEEARVHAERALELAPDVATAVRELALILGALEHPREALDLARRAFRLDPNDAHVRLTLAEWLVYTGNHAEALRVLTGLDVKQLHEHCSLILLERLGEAHLNLGHLEDSEAAYLELTENDPANSLAWGGLGIIYLRRGDPERAVESYRRAYQIVSEEPFDPGDATALFNRRTVPHNLGLALMRSGRAEESLEFFEEVVSLDPEDPEGFFSLGVALIEAGRSAEAVALLEEALVLDPGMTHAYLPLALALYEQGEYDECLEVAERVLERNPLDLEALRLTVQAWRNLGEYERALGHARELVLAKPDWAEGHGILGHVLEELDDIEGALAAWREGARLDPSNEEIQRHLRYGGSGIVELRGVVQERPDDADALNELAWELALDPDTNEFDPGEAVELARRATELEPGQGYIWNTLGLALIRTQRWDEAIEALERSIALSDEEDALDSYLLVQAWQGKGDSVRAREAYEHASELDARGAPDLARWALEARALLGLDPSDG